MAPSCAAFLGTTETLCNHYLKVDITTEREKVENAIQNLINKGAMFQIFTGSKDDKQSPYVLSMSVKAEKRVRSKKIKQAYLQAIEKCPGTTSIFGVGSKFEKYNYDVMLLMTYLRGCSPKVKTCEQVAKDIGLPIEKVEHMIRVFSDIIFADAGTNKKVAQLYKTLS